MKNKEQLLQEMMQNIVNRAVGINIMSDVPLSFSQMQDLFNLNVYCVQQTLSDEEVARDPRKLTYKANHELAVALQAICLSQSMIRPQRTHKETKAFFSDNISVSMSQDGIKHVSFGAVMPDLVQEAIYTGIVEDWKIYRDREGMKIKSLIDVKTNFTGLSGYMRGGDCVNEFARFNRKFFEREKGREERAKESMQNAMRSAVIQNLFSKMTDNLLLEGKSPQEIMTMLLNSNEFMTNKNFNYSNASQLIDSRVEKQIANLLEDKNYDSRSR